MTSVKVERRTLMLTTLDQPPKGSVHESSLTIECIRIPVVSLDHV